LLTPGGKDVALKIDFLCPYTKVFPLCSGGIVRNHFKHSVELVDVQADIVDVLAAVEDFLLAQATYDAAVRRWPKERIRLSQQSRVLEDSAKQ